MLTDITVEFDGFESYDVEPAAVRDVFADRPVIIQGKWRGGAHGTVTIEGVWTVGSYLNMSPVLRIQGRVVREDGVPPYGAVFDEVVAQLHTARMQPGATIAVCVDPQNPVDMAIDWIRTGQIGPPPPGSIPGAGEPGARPAADA